MTEEEVLQLAAEKKKFIDITDHQDLSSLPGLVAPNYPDQPAQKETVTRVIQSINMETLKTNLGNLSAFYTRYYNSDTGVQSAQWIFNVLNTYAQGRSDITVQYFPHSWKQQSIIARIQGAVNPDDLVIIGAHQDSINGATGRAPGSDDDGSGTVTVLEAFRALIQNNFKPNRTTEFHFNAAEEVGLRGAQAIAQKYRLENVNVLAYLQFDMTLFEGRTTSEPIGIITDYTNPQLTTFVRKLIDSYLSINWANSACGYGCSDHAAWTSAGFPSAFPFETPFGRHNPYIHTSQDTVQWLSWDHGHEYVKLAVAFVVELASTNWKA